MQSRSRCPEPVAKSYETERQIEPIEPFRREHRQYSRQKSRSLNQPLSSMSLENIRMTLRTGVAAGCSASRRDESAASGVRTGRGNVRDPVTAPDDAAIDEHIRRTAGRRRPEADGDYVSRRSRRPPWSDRRSKVIRRREVRQAIRSGGRAASDCFSRPRAHWQPGDASVRRSAWQRESPHLAEPAGAA